MLIIKHFKTLPDYLANHLGKSSIVITAVLIINFNGSLVMAETLPSSDLGRATEQDIQAKQRIESERQYLIRSKEAEEISNIGKSKSRAAKQVTPEQLVEDQTCKLIQNFEFSGNKVRFKTT